MDISNKIFEYEGLRYSGYIWVNNELIPYEEANVHILTHSLHYGGAVFEGIRAENGKMFRVRDHMQRLIRSAELIGMTSPYDVDTLVDAAYELLSMNSLNCAYVRPLMWRSSDMLRIVPVQQYTNCMIGVWDASFHKRVDNIHLNTTTWIKPPPNVWPYQSKSAMHYPISTMVGVAAKESGFDDSIFLDWRGYIAECTSSNIFFVKNDKLFTPIPDCFLNGFTRQTIIQLAREHGIDVVETYMTFDDLNDATEAFITGTAAGVRSVASITSPNRVFNFTQSNVTSMLENAYNHVVGN